MAMRTQVEFTGGKELERALLELSTKSAQRVGRAALRKAGNPILKKAKAIVRKREPRLAKALKLRVDRMKDNHAHFSALIYVSKKQFDYRPRKTNRRTRVKGKLIQAPYSYQIGSRPDVYGRFIEWGRHKQGIRAFPFMRPAWDSEGGRVAQGRLGDALWEGISKEARRIAPGLETGR